MKRVRVCSRGSGNISNEGGGGGGGGGGILEVPFPSFFLLANYGEKEGEKKKMTTIFFREKKVDRFDKKINFWKNLLNSVSLWKMTDVFPKWRNHGGRGGGKGRGGGGGGQEKNGLFSPFFYNPLTTQDNLFSSKAIDTKRQKNIYSTIHVYGKSHVGLFRLWRDKKLPSFFVTGTQPCFFFFFPFVPVQSNLLKRFNGKKLFPGKIIDVFRTYPTRHSRRYVSDVFQRWWLA